MCPVTYSGCLGDRYTSLGPQTLVPKKHFSNFLFSVVLQQYVEVAINDFTMHLIILKWLKIQNYRQKRKTMRQRGWSERRYCQWKHFHSFNYIIHHASIWIFFNVNSFHCLWFLLYYLLHLSSSDHFAALTSLQPYKFFIWIYEFFINHPW